MKKYKVLNILVFGLLMVTSCSVKQVATQKQYDKEALAQMMEALENAITDTPYCALIQKTSVEAVLEDDYVKRINHAKVLKTFRGQQLNNISYISYTEKGDSIQISDKPVVITLCVKNGGFYLPYEAGSEFPAIEEAIKKAEVTGKKLKFVKQQSFSDCEWPE